MKHGITTTMDSAGRLVLPKEIRDKAQLEPGEPLRIVCRDGRVEMEPVLREVRIVRKDRMRVAIPMEDGDGLKTAVVSETLKSIRADRMAVVVP